MRRMIVAVLAVVLSCSLLCCAHNDSSGHEYRDKCEWWREDCQNLYRLISYRTAGGCCAYSREMEEYYLQNRQYQKTAATAGCLFIECTHTIIFTRW